jgi:hypothetical protein
MFELAEISTNSTLKTKPLHYELLRSSRSCQIVRHPKGMEMRLQKYQWLYLIIVGLLCAPALLLRGSLQRLEKREPANKLGGDDV